MHRFGPERSERNGYNDEKRKERVNYMMEQYFPPLTGNASKKYL